MSNAGSMSTPQVAEMQTKIIQHCQVAEVCLGQSQSVLSPVSGLSLSGIYLQHCGLLQIIICVQFSEVFTVSESVFTAPCLSVA